MRKTLKICYFYLFSFNAASYEQQRILKASIGTQCILNQPLLLQTVFNYFNKMRRYNFLPTQAHDEEPANYRKHSYLSHK